MIFSVEWLQSAVNQLTAIWTQADSGLRQTITSATHTIDERLRTDSIGHSESRSEDSRILLESPLGVTFRVEADGHRVCVLRVWLFRTRSA